MKQAGFVCFFFSIGVVGDGMIGLYSRRGQESEKGMQDKSKYTKQTAVLSVKKTNHTVDDVVCGMNESNKKCRKCIHSATHYPTIRIISIISH